MSPSSVVSRRVIRVLIADDSAVVQEFLQEILDEEPDMLVVGVARNGEEVLQKVKTLRPDLVTMDVNMPRLDGVEATRRIMADCPTPIAVVTAAPVDPGSDVAFNAMAAGAVEALAKPRRADFESHPSLRDAFVRQLRNVAYVRVVGIRGIRSGLSDRALGRPSTGQPSPAARNLPNRVPELIAVGASTGGPPALREALARLDPDTCPPVAVVQHMSGEFLPGFATWLDGVVPPKVEVAVSGSLLKRGSVYVAPGDRHLVVSRGRIGLVDRPPVHFQRPSADVLFESVAQHYGSSAVGVLLTGMGRDGAEGLLAMKTAGAFTIAQDEGSCLVYGMPRAAMELEAAKAVATPEQAAQLLRHLAAGHPKRRASGEWR